MIRPLGAVMFCRIIVLITGEVGLVVIVLVVVAVVIALFDAVVAVVERGEVVFTSTQVLLLSLRVMELGQLQE